MGGAGELAVVAVAVGEEDHYLYALLLIQQLPLYLHSHPLVDDLLAARKAEGCYLEDRSHQKQQRKEQLFWREQWKGVDSNKLKRIETQEFDGVMPISLNAESCTESTK